MDLHPKAAVEKLAAQHSDAFAMVHRYLQVAVPDTVSRFSDRHPDPKDIHGMLLCTTARDAVLWMGLNDPVMAAASLTMSAGPALSVVLQDGKGTKIRVRKFPTDRLSGDRVRVVEMPEQPTLDEDLFGPVGATDSYELFALWSPDLLTGTLEAVFLAAVADIDSPSRVRVFAAVQLPPPPAMPGSLPAGPRIGPPLGSPPVDDFDDQIAGQDQDGTSS